MKQTGTWLNPSRDRLGDAPASTVAAPTPTGVVTVDAGAPDEQLLTPRHARRVAA